MKAAIVIKIRFIAIVFKLFWSCNITKKYWDRLIFWKKMLLDSNKTHFYTTNMLFSYCQNHIHGSFFRFLPKQRYLCREFIGCFSWETWCGRLQQAPSVIWRSSESDIIPVFLMLWCCTIHNNYLSLQSRKQVPAWWNMQTNLIYLIDNRPKIWWNLSTYSSG